MKTIGLLGGMSHESSTHYYEMINQGVKARLGGHHSAQSLMYSIDFAELVKLMDAGEWNEADAMMVAAAKRLEAGGADCVVLCTNTMHRAAQKIIEAVSIPFLHIADATAELIRSQEIDRVGLLGTRATMEQDFYRGRLEQAGLSVVTPIDRDRQRIHDVIFQELCLGIIRDESRDEYRRIMGGLADEGAQGIILGCTELNMLVGQNDASIPLFDTTSIHAAKAVDFALSE